MKKYKTTIWSIDIEEVEIIKVTEKMVFYFKWGRERRETKSSHSHIYHDSKEDAIKYLYNRIIEDIERSKKHLEIAKNQLSEFKAAHWIKD